MAARVRWTGTTTQRGYGWGHQAEQKRRLALWRPGDPCARCGRPMWQRWQYVKGRRVSAIHLGHTPDRSAYTGLEHAHCNLSEAARRGNRMRARSPVRTVPLPLRTSRRW